MQLQGERVVEHRVASIEKNTITVEATLIEFDEDLGDIGEDLDTSRYLVGTFLWVGWI